MGKQSDIAGLASACAALGIDVETLPHSIRFPQARAAAHEPLQDAPLGLTDAEWESLSTLLPPEPPQAETLSNRTVVDKVLWVIVKGRRWTALGAGHEAVRRKFGRWAHLSVWQQLADDAAVCAAISPLRLAQLQRVAQRAQILCHKSAKGG